MPQVLCSKRIHLIKHVHQKGVYGDCHLKDWTHECTTKGSKVGHGGKVVHLMVAISYGKGVIRCEQYHKMNGEYFKSFIDDNFKDMFQRAQKDMLFIQDGDPSQNSKLARDAMESVGCTLLKIPPRRPDINPIENFFHLVGKKLTEDVFARNITSETYQQFAARVKKTIEEFDKGIIDSIILSMHRRMCAIVKCHGERLKY